jgi:hypothetical protein
LVVAGPAGDEVGLVGGDGGQPDREVGELLVEPGPQDSGGRGVGGLQLRGAGGLPVEGGTAELAGVGGGLPVARGEVAAGELADEVVGGGVIGAPATIDDLGVVAGVVGVSEVTIFNSGGYGIWSGGVLRGMPEV